MQTLKGPHPIFTFYITACRNVMPPGVYRQIFSNKKMPPPQPGVPYAYYDENREPCADFQRQSMWSMTLRYPHLQVLAG